MLVHNYLSAVGQRQINVIISANVRSPNIAALATALGWNGSQLIQVTINSGVDVASLSISGIGANLLHIINNGRIGGVMNAGTGLYTRTPIRITNNGTIFGGGGQGGLGGLTRFGYGSGWAAECRGGAGGTGAGFNTSGTLAFMNANAGSAGESAAYTGATFPGDTQPAGSGGVGGTGGSIGQPGTAGSAGDVSGSASDVVITGGEPGQLAGYYVDGIDFVTFVTGGVLIGRVI